MKRSTNILSAPRIPSLLMYHHLLNVSRQRQDGDPVRTIVERKPWMIRMTCRRYLSRAMDLMVCTPDMQQQFPVDPVMLEFGWANYSIQPWAADISRHGLHH